MSLYVTLCGSSRGSREDILLDRVMHRAVVACGAQPDQAEVALSCQWLSMFPDPALPRLL